VPKGHAAGDVCWRHPNAKKFEKRHSLAPFLHGIRGRTRSHTMPSKKNDPHFKSLKEHFDIMMHLGKVQVTRVVAMPVDGVAWDGKN
jgi:hypothetical protein